VPWSKNAWSYTFTPPIRLHSVVLIKKSTGTTLPLPLVEPLALSLVALLPALSVDP